MPEGSSPAPREDREHQGQQESSGEQEVHQRIRLRRRGEAEHTRDGDRKHVVKKMSPAARRTLRRNIHDAAWGDFVRKLEYKAEGAGKRVVKVEAKNTTQECSHCGEIVYKDLSVRTHRCPYCGFEMDRDENAANNILNRGLTILRAGNRPQPAEEDASTARKGSKRPSMKQEATAL